MKIHYKRASRLISLLLAFVFLINLPLSSYANVQTPSNIEDISNSDSAFNIDSENVMKFEDISSDEEYQYWLENVCPFYFDEDGNKVYDIDTFPERYYSTENYSISALCVALIMAGAAALGFVIPSSSISDFSSSFLAWVDRFKMGVAADLKAGVLGLATTITLLKEYLASSWVSVDSGAGSLTVQTRPSDFGSPVCPGFDSTITYDYAFLLSKSVIEDSGDILYYDYFFKKSTFDSLVAASIMQTNDSDSTAWLKFLSASGNFGFERVYHLKQRYYSEGYWANPSVDYSSSFYIPFDIFLNFPFPVFINDTALISWRDYGTTGGMLNGELSNQTSIIAQNIYSGISDIMKDYTIADKALTDEEAALLQTDLGATTTYDDVLAVLKKFFSFTSTGGSTDVPVLTPALSYSFLKYCASAIAGYCGVTLSDDLFNVFILELSGQAVPDDSDQRFENAKLQVALFLSQYVVLNGGSGSPDDDPEKNSYKILKSFAVSLGAFLVASGLVSDSADFDNEPQINPNLQVVDNLTENPDSPDGSTSVDLSGVLKFLQNILNALSPITNIYTLLQSLSNPLLSIPTLISSIETAIKSIPKLISGELTLPELFGNVTGAIFAMPQQVADAIAHALGLKQLLDGLRLSELFDNVIELIPDKLIKGFALPDLFAGISTVVGAIPQHIADLFGLTSGFSLNDILNNLAENISALPDAFKQKFPDKVDPDDSSDSDDPNDPDFINFINSFMLLILILVLLIILFVNCLRFIVLVFNIPASTAILNDDLLSGIQYLKDIQLPLFNMSLYSLLLACAYFVIFMSVITMLRKRIDHLHI
ncbi:MAG: hypothetical protein PHV18_14155 [Lachnospiraceae bacterium]|nr:hypothetical protein [Lachnospiraceae bacterium]